MEFMKLKIRKKFAYLTAGTLLGVALLFNFPGDQANARGGKYRWVRAKGGLSLRVSPATNAKRIRIIPDKAKVRFLGEAGSELTLSGRFGRWSRVNYRGKNGWVFGGFLSELAPGQKPPPPTVRFDGPANGWTALKVVDVSGRITNSRGIQEAVFIQNGVSRSIPVNNGVFRQKVVLGAGANYIRVIAKNEGGVGSSSLKLVTNNSQMDVKVILSWDTNHTDVDLWVTDPNQERVYYAHRRSKLGGALDVDITSGYGPETFTLQKAAPGEYLVQVQYYGGSKPTMAKILVVLREGTPREKRLTFPALLHKSGSGITIGKFTVN